MGQDYTPLCRHVNTNTHRLLPGSTSLQDQRRRLYSLRSWFAPRSSVQTGQMSLFKLSSQIGYKYMSKDTCLMDVNRERVHRAVMSVLFLEKRTIDFWLIPSLYIKQQSQCGQVGKKNQILEAEGQIAISGSYFHCHASLRMSFQLLAILVSLFVKSFLSPLVTRRVQWGNRHSINIWNKPTLQDASRM